MLEKKTVQFDDECMDIINKRIEEEHERTGENRERLFSKVVRLLIKGK